MSRITRLASASAVALAVVLTTMAAPAEAAPAHAPAQPTTQVYTVKPGDYLSGIATKLQVSLDALLAANGLTKKSVIHPGDQLVVPAGGVLPGTPPPPPAVTGGLYTVKPGDYFKRIAAALGVSMDALLAANNMKKTTVIHPGDQLQVPVGATLPPVVSGPSANVTTVLDFVTAQLGEPYQKGGAGPNAWDCSGLTMRAYAAIGINLPHYSAAQAKYGVAIDWTTQAILPGDLIFLATNGTISHVGIATGPKTWIHSPNPGDVVRASDIPLQRVVAVRRLVNGG
ncbi:MAG: LysM peptidoglycan-binding domain-containing protein [Actinomycetia bacterium]|nr:LysM peptidoglycan-binding domain-containing protein [Actinomycetes bacterium]